MFNYSTKSQCTEASIEFLLPWERRSNPTKGTSSYILAYILALLTFEFSLAKLLTLFLFKMECYCECIQYNDTVLWTKINTNDYNEFTLMHKNSNKLNFLHLYTPCVFVNFRSEVFIQGYRSVYDTSNVLKWSHNFQVLSH